MRSDAQALCGRRRVFFSNIFCDRVFQRPTYLRDPIFLSLNILLHFWLTGIEKIDES